VTGPGQTEFLAALGALREGLEALGAPWMCIGGVAVIASGVPRFTGDIDATILASAVDPERVVRVMASHRITPRIEQAVEFARQRHVVLLRHEPSDVPVDVSLTWLPFEEEAIRRAMERDYGGVPVRVPRVEDLIIYKMVAARTRDLEDVERLLLLHAARLDVARIKRIVVEFAEVLEDRTRVEALERLLRSAGLER